MATINAALSACGGTNEYVLLGPGTFNLNGTILFPAAGHVVLRGSGANSTFIVGGSSGFSGCVLHTAIICALSPTGSAFGNPVGVTAWTAGYTQGSNSITVGSTSGISTTDPPTIIMLEQCDTGYTASSASASCTGSATDNGQLFVCEDAYNGTTGCSNDGPGNGNAHRGQFEMTTATNIAGSVLTLADPLIYPQWTSRQTPRIWSGASISTVGVENLAIDNTANSANDLIQFFNAYNYWVSGCKFTNWAFWGIEVFQGLHGTIQNNYFYHTTGVDSYSIRFEGAGRNLIQNNIMTQALSSVVFDGPSSGNVVAYNFSINNNFSNDFMKGAYFEHAVNAYDLYEGNVTNQILNDGDHGTANMITHYRNFILGWDSCANGQCGSNVHDTATNALYERSWGRYQNDVANIAGTPGYHTLYNTLSSNLAVFQWGIGNGATTPPNPNDPLVYSTSLIWSNYDTVNNAVRCNNSEVPTGASTYPNSIPTLGCSGGTLPASFYLSSRPAWWSATIPFPAIGPDVSSGNVGQCSGVLNTAGHQSGMPATSSAQCIGTTLTTPAWGGHVNAIPAVACYLTTMGGQPDGSGNALVFDGNTCYGKSAAPAPPPSSGLQPPAPPKGLVAIIN